MVKNFYKMVKIFYTFGLVDKVGNSGYNSNSNREGNNFLSFHSVLRTPFQAKKLFPANFFLPTRGLGVGGIKKTLSGQRGLLYQILSQKDKVLRVSIMNKNIEKL